MDEDEDIRAPIVDGEELPEIALDPSGPPQLTILSLLILALMALLLVIVGTQSIETERRFFKNMTLNINQEIADLLSQQFVQAFSAATGLVEDLSRFPTVRRAVVPDRSSGDVEKLLNIVTSRNPVLRALTVVDRAGEARARSVGVNALVIKDFPAERRKKLLEGERAAALSKQYLGGGGKLCIGFASSVMGARRGDVPEGTVEAEISLDFLQRLVDSVQVGHTGRVLVVDADRNVVFSSTGLKPEQVEDFNRYFPPDSFALGKLGISYGPPGDRDRYLASMRTVKSVSHKGLDASVVLRQSTPISLPNFTSTVHPREIPDWMIVVQQDFDEGIALASRMKYNILLLVAIGLVGLLVIAKLWWDSDR